jgi:tRNA(fMet)-specific endonuclease VapC
LWFGIGVDSDTARFRRRQRWLEKTFRRLEVVPLDAAVARVHARLWLQLANAGLMIGPHDLIVAAVAMHRRWVLATFNVAEFRHIRGLEVIEPQNDAGQFGTA